MNITLDNGNKFVCPRLLDYVIVIGCKEAKQFLNTTTLTREQLKQHQQQPELLRRYPLTDHADFKLPNDVTYFCQPEGCLNHMISSKAEKHLLKNKVTSFIFTLTEKDSARVRYGICINFYRQSYHQTRQQHRVKPAKKYSTTSSESSTNESQQQQQPSVKLNQIYTLTSLCIISHHPFFTLLRECLNILHRIIESCNDQSEKHLFESATSLIPALFKNLTPSSPSKMNYAKNYLSIKNQHKFNLMVKNNVWKVLTGVPINENIFNLTSKYICEIETWILRLLSAPVPIPGKTKVILDIMPNEPPMLFALPDHTRFNLVDFPIHLPLELLGVDLCMKVFTLILLENKVVFQSRDYNALTMSIMAFVYLLYPLEYMFPIIPLLPMCMNDTEQLLLAPTPFLIGISANFFEYKANFALPDDVWLVDLDKNRIIPAKHSELPEIPDIPEPENRIVRNHLNQALNSLSCSPEPIKNFQIFFNEQAGISGAQQTLTPAHLPRPNENLQDLISKSFNPLIYGNDVDSVDVAARITMVQFLVNSKNTLLNYNEHTRTLRLYPRPVVAFQYNSFLRSRPIKSTFIIKLAKTQAVEYLAEWSLCPTNVAYLRIQTGIFDPSLIGDKAKWYCRYLTPIQFRVYSEKVTLLADILKSANKAAADENNNNGNRLNSTSDTPTDESGASGSSDFENVDEEQPQVDDVDFKQTQRNVTNLLIPADQLNTMCVDVKSVFRPPSKFINSEDENEANYERNANSCGLSPNSNPQTTLGNIGYESSFTTSSSSSSVGELYNSNDNMFTPSSAAIGQTLTNLLNQQLSYDLKSSSTTITPVNKTFPRLDEDHRRAYSSSGTASSAVNPQQPISRSVNSVNNLKTKQLSLISQLSDEISDVANKAAKKVSEFVNETNSGQQHSIQVPSAKPPLLQSSGKKSVSPLPRLQSFDANSTSSSMLSINASSNATPTLTPRQIQPQHQPVPQHHHQQPPQLPPSTTITDINNENQQFLKEVLNNVLEGQGVGWLKYNRIKRLMEDENYRNFVLSRLNTSLDKKFSSDEEHIEDVKLTKPVFKGMIKLIQAIVYGLEQTYANNGIGGMASAYQLFEIVHTHYWVRENQLGAHANKNDSSPVSNMPSPFGSKENLSSLPQQPSSYSISGKPPQFTASTAPIAASDTTTASSLVTQLGNLWSNSKLNSFTKTLSSQLTSAATATSHKSTPLANSNKPKPQQQQQQQHQIQKYSQQQQYHQYQIPYYNNEATNPLYEETNSEYDEYNENRSFGDDKFVDPLTTPHLMQTPSAASANRSPSPSSRNSKLIKMNKHGSLDSNDSSASKLDDRRKSKINHHSIKAFNEQNIDDLNNNSSTSTSTSAASSIPLSSTTSSIQGAIDSFTNSSKQLRTQSISLYCKSQLSTGYRYTSSNLIAVSPIPSNVEKCYLFEILIHNPRSPLWDQMQFWEDVFLDAVAQERDIIGLDQGPSEMMERYYHLGNAEKKRLELDEDRLLAVMLYNLIAFMITMRVGKEEIRRKIRRMLGKCHIGLAMSQQVNELLDNIHKLSANDVDLRPTGNRLMQKQCFTIHSGTDNTGDMLFMEVCDDCLIVRSVKGEICQRWWFEKLVNMTYCPKTKVLCLWCKHDGETQLNKFYTKKCRELYFSIKEAMEKAASRLSQTDSQTNPELGGEFPINDLKTNQAGVLQICMDGICLIFGTNKEFIELKRVRKCTTQKDDIFVLEEFDPKTKQLLIRKYKSSMASLAILSFHRVISVLLEQQVSQPHQGKLESNVSLVTAN